MQSEVYCIKCLIDCITRKIKENRHDAFVRDSANRLCTAINIIRLVENIKRFMERMHNYIKPDMNTCQHICTEQYTTTLNTFVLDIPFLLSNHQSIAGR